MTQKFAQARHTTRGFSLVEFAIVLSIAGIIMGCIWSLAGVMNRDVQQEKFSEMLANIVGNIRGNYAGKTAMESTIVGTMMPLLTSMNVFPGDAVRSVAGPTSIVDSPFGEMALPLTPGMPLGNPYNSIYVCGWTASGKNAAGNSLCEFAGAGVSNVPLFAIEALISAGQNCFGAVMSNSNPATLPGLVAVYINGKQQPLPVNIATVQTNCVAYAPGNSSAAVIDFVFRLTP